MSFSNFRYGLSLTTYIYILLKIIEGPMLSIITLMHFVSNVFENQFYDLA